MKVFSIKLKVLNSKGLGSGGRFACLCLVQILMSVTLSGTKHLNP